MRMLILASLMSTALLAPVAAQAQEERRSPGGWSQRAPREARGTLHRAAPPNQSSRAPAREAARRDRQQDGRAFQQERRADPRGYGEGEVSQRRFRAERQDDRRVPNLDRREDAHDFRWDGHTDLRQYQQNRRFGYDSARRYNEQQRFGQTGRFDNGRAWSQDWRRDDRFDWRRYRYQNRSAYRLPRYYAPRGYDYGYRRFGIGASLSALLFGQNYWINDPFAYRLPPAYGPYRWVRYYDDVLLVDVRSGRVIDVEYDIFW